MQKITKTIKNCDKNNENFSKTNGKRLGIAFLSSAQQCSAVFNLQLISKFPEFLRVKELKTNPTNTTKSIKNCGKTMKSGQKQWEHTHTKQMEESGELDFSATHSSTLSSTQQCSICNQFQGFLTFSRVRDEKGENEAKIHSNNLEKTMKSGQNNGKTHTQNKWKKAGNWISQQHSAALSSTQQCSICNQFQGFLTFCRVRDEKGENEAKKKCKIHQKIGKTMISGQNNGKTHTKQIQKGWEFDFPAALSSTQQCSICNQFQGFLTFCRVRGEKAENEAKKTQNPSKIGETMNSGQNKRKTQTKKREKGWELDFPAALSSTQQHSAVLNLQPISRFPDFLQGQG